MWYNMGMKTMIMAAVLATAGVVQAMNWTGLGEENHYSGQKLTEESLAGKVVMVDEWGFRCPPCRALLPRMEQLWQSFKSKPFVLVGSHRQGHRPDEVKALIDEHKLTYPIYDRFGLADGEPDNGGGIPFIYVVNHRGKVVYSGRSERDATQAVVEAITKVGMPPDLLPEVQLVKYKNLQKKFALGQNMTSVVKALGKDVAAAERKTATKVQKEKAEEASAILAALENGKKDVRDEIDALEKTNPADAVKYIQLYAKSFPGEAGDFRERLTALKELSKSKK